MRCWIVITAAVLVTVPEAGLAQRGTTPVDQYGRHCITVTKTGTRTGIRHGPNKFHSRYDYEVSNGCNRRISVTLTTNSGKKHYVVVPAGETRKKFCTDGFPANADCNGGYGSYEARYD